MDGYGTMERPLRMFREALKSDKLKPLFGFLDSSGKLHVDKPGEREEVLSDLALIMGITR